MKYERFILFPRYFTNCYLLWEEDSLEAMLIDPAEESREIANRIRKLGLFLKYIVNTHGHADHIAGNRFFVNEFGSPLLIHRNDESFLIDPKQNLSAFYGANITSPPASRTLIDKDELSLGNTPIHIIEVP